MIGSKSHESPFKWTIIIALVFLLKALEIPSIDKLPLLSTSANIGFKPIFNTQLADMTKDLGVTITSSFSIKFRALSASSNATLPLDTATEYFVPW